MPRIEFAHLSPSERLELIEALWESLDAADIPPTTEQGEELDRRLATADADLPSSVPWETIRVEAANRYR